MQGREDAKELTRLVEARRDAQRYANKFNTDVAIWKNPEGTLLTRELRYLEDYIQVLEVVTPKLKPKLKKESMR
jgi:hypothetical protein